VHRKTVLVVDDDASSRFVLSKAVEGLGFRAVIAEDGIDVPDLVAKEHFDLLVLDLYMPGMNGFELLRQVRKPQGGLLPAPRTASDVPILIVSGECDPDSLANVKSLGANYQLSKPIDLNEFEDCVRSALRTRPKKDKVPSS